MSLVTWSWIFLVVYVAAMLAIGVAGQRRVRNADDFATARASYGPLFLAFAFAATTASGATFIGFPGLTYRGGLPLAWGTVLYPLGVLVGVRICIRLVRDAGHLYGSRSIPEYLGERYRSDLMRILVSLFSLLLLVYLAGQLVSGLVMFQLLLGLGPGWALGITSAVLLVYVVLGGAHADILTDGVQGFLMVVLAAGVVVMFFVGYGVAGGLPGLLSTLRADDPKLVGWLDPGNALARSWWSVLVLFLAHVPLGMLPHLGNKIWALETDAQRFRFVRWSFLFTLLVGMLGLGGILARGVLGPGLANSNEALPALIIALFPPWLAALLAVGVLSAVMSTADGLVVSSSQIVANDLYRLTVVPRWRRHLDAETVDRQVLAISRWATVAVLLLCTWMAWATMHRNVTLLVWMGTGGLMAAFAGPLVLGAVWRGVTRAGALAGLVAGAAVFGATHAGLVDPAWFAEGGALARAAAWLAAEAPNPYSCAALGELASVAATWGVSKVTEPLPPRHLEALFPTR